MSDFERVKKAMQMAWKHKVTNTPVMALSDDIWDLLAEAAVKMMWLIEHENGTREPV